MVGRFSISNIMQSLEKQIILRIQSQCNDWVFSKDDFLDLGTAELANKALHRLNKSKILMHIFDGIYYKPKFSKLLDKELSPNMEELVLAIARKNQWVTSPTGDFALNILGLSTQVPARIVYLSSGSSCSYEYGRQTIRFIQAPLKEINFKHYESKILVQAILSLGKDHQIENDLIKLIRKKFSPAQKKLILEDTVETYEWVRDVVIKICENQ